LSGKKYLAILVFRLDGLKRVSFCLAFFDRLDFTVFTGDLDDKFFPGVEGEKVTFLTSETDCRVSLAVFKILLGAGSCGLGLNAQESVVVISI
jgi:hypothetical protein